MAPRAGSRYIFCRGIRDYNRVKQLSDREPYGYQELSDNRTHEVREGDTLFSLAGLYFRPVSRACGYWWVIADFQPDPIVDPTLKLPVGQIVYIPSTRTLRNRILSEERRRLH